jgi:hypothetical protein
LPAAPAHAAEDLQALEAAIRSCDDELKALRNQQKVASLDRIEAALSAELDKAVASFERWKQKHLAPVLGLIDLLQHSGGNGRGRASDACDRAGFRPHLLHYGSTLPKPMSRDEAMAIVDQYLAEKEQHR